MGCSRVGEDKGPGYDGLMSLDLFLRHLGATEGFQARVRSRMIFQIAAWRREWSWQDQSQGDTWEQILAIAKTEDTKIVAL